MTASGRGLDWLSEYGSRFTRDPGNTVGEKIDNFRAKNNPLK